MEEAFRAYLLATSSVTDICGTRINPVDHPQGLALPAIVYHVASDNVELTLVNGPDGLSQGRVQVDCYGHTYASAKILSRAVRAALDGYRGGSFRMISHTGTRDKREGGSNEADRPYRVQMDFLTYWRP